MEYFYVLSFSKTIVKCMMTVRLVLFLLFISLSIPCVSKEKIDPSMRALDVACLIGDKLVKETPFAYKLELESNSNIFNGIQKVDLVVITRLEDRLLHMRIRN